MIWFQPISTALILRPYLHKAYVPANSLLTMSHNFLTYCCFGGDVFCSLSCYFNRSKGTFGLMSSNSNVIQFTYKWLQPTLFIWGSSQSPLAQEGLLWWFCQEHGKTIEPVLYWVSFLKPYQLVGLSKKYETMDSNGPFELCRHCLAKQIPLNVGLFSDEQIFIIYLH